MNLLYRPLLFTVIGLTLAYSLFSQTRYNDYQSSDKVFKYREDFSSSNYYWENSVEGKSSAEIIDGVLRFRSLNDRAQAKYKAVDDLNWNGDWEIEIGVRWVNGKTNSAIDFVWDRTPGKSEKYHFGFTAEKKYVISRYDNGYQKIVGFTPSDIVNGTTRNRLTVRKVSNTYYFFFNEQLVKTHPFSGITGNHVGFTVPRSSTSDVDYLYVRQLNKPLSQSSNYSNSNPSNVVDANGGYIAVMTKNNGYNLQRWKTRDAFPKDAIKADWKDGYNISSLSYNNNQWVLTTSKGTGYTTQTWMTRREWKKDDIRSKWDEGYKISEVSYGNGAYAIVFSKNSGLGKQRWATNGSSFPSDKIREFGDEGLKITKVIYGADRWLLIASQDSKIKNQKWFKRSKFPQEDIERWSNEGYSITQLSKENGWWVLVMSQYFSGRRPTVWFNSSEFPKEQIREYWKTDYYLTGITYVKPNVSSNTNNTRTITKASTTVDDIESKIVGEWYGGATGEDKGYFTFYSDKIIKMVSKGEVIGGYDYNQGGVKVDIVYELTKTSTPNQYFIDITFKSIDTQFGKLKGILEMQGNDSFKMKLAESFNASRPLSLVDSQNNKVSYFRRTN